MIKARTKSESFWREESRGFCDTTYVSSESELTRLLDCLDLKYSRCRAELKARQFSLELLDWKSHGMSESVSGFSEAVLERLYT